MEKIVEILKKQIEYYPDMEIQDVLKALYQSVFGCGHFVYDEGKCKELLLKELDTAENGGLVTEKLGEYSRIHLGSLEISPELLLRLFMLSAKKEEREEEYKNILHLLPVLCEDNVLPFNKEEMKKVIAEHIAMGCPSLHHSNRFRKKYHPAYRVIKSEFAELICLLSDIEGLIKSKKAPIIAIDGKCSVGKSTLGRRLAEIFNAELIHMDDYFLPFDRRTPERMSEVGGNIDYERFHDELLLPLSRGEAYISRPYRCHGGYYEEGIKKEPHGLTIVEGSYSLHPTLEKYYDLKVFMTLDGEAQISRLEKRDPEMLDRFVSTWIPLENRYFEGTYIEKRCDILIRSGNDYELEVIKNEKRSNI